MYFRQTHRKIATLDSGFSDEENLRACWLRAVEWGKWPAFISQPLIPLLYIFYPVQWVLLSVIVANILWAFVRYRFTSLAAATWGALFVRLKWLTIPTTTAYFLFYGRYWVALLALTVPLYAAVLGIFTGSFKIGISQQKFMAELGYVHAEDVDSEAASASDH